LILKSREISNLNFGGKQIEQLPVSVARWQHGSQICFATFYIVENHKIAKNSATTKAREKMSTDLESLEFYKKI
jgi:hypothetical protein